MGLSHLVGTPLASESPGPKSSGSEDNDGSCYTFKYLPLVFG